ncbi:serine/threonine protein kinase [Bacillus pakistanensis]|uniref:Serine/threonine protein kinase n=2 Tax=Rossellomorea pakistanensis TaxID=992288 RepID=A0ABS2NAD6_9BACI|nr:serine/threonine protein kinase [Bacillus pakistanensis]
MTLRVNGRGDDHLNRLLYFLRLKLNLKYAQLQEIKQGKWLLSTQNEKWFLKEFSTEKKFMKQLILTKELLKRGYSQVLAFHPIHQTSPIRFDGKLYGLMEWLEHEQDFGYSHEYERQYALQTLKQFHDVTKKILLESPQLSKYFDENNYLSKWESRLAEFTNNIPYLQAFIPLYYLLAYKQWGEWSLHRLKNMSFAPTNYCIIHGDVAHHNFLLSKNGKLYLIDFDLATIAAEEVDDLQFANRILPYLKWSTNELFSSSLYHVYRKDKVFLMALVYPTDIYREWNRFLRENIRYKDKVWNYLVDLSINQFSYRMLFIQKIGGWIQYQE